MDRVELLIGVITTLRVIGNSKIMKTPFSDLELNNFLLFFRNTACNTLRGAYDGTIFPQNITKDEQFRLYRKAFCRTLPIRFDHAGTLEELNAYFFKLDENAFNSDIDDPQSSCFCENKKCLKKGLGNITPCYYSEYTNSKSLTYVIVGYCGIIIT